MIVQAASTRFIRRFTARSGSSRSSGLPRSAYRQRAVGDPDQALHEHRPVASDRQAVDECVRQRVRGRFDDLDAAFATLGRLRPGGLVIGTDLFLTSRIEQLAALGLRYSIAVVFQYREFVSAGGLMSYGTSPSEPYRWAGVYAARILKGEKPAELPVQQASKVELFINLKTAKALGLEIPPTLLARADEVIE